MLLCYIESNRIAHFAAPSVDDSTLEFGGQNNANLCRPSAAGGFDSGNTDLNDPKTIELHRSDLLDRNGGIGAGENVACPYT